MARTGDDITPARAHLQHLNTLCERADRSRGAAWIPTTRASRSQRSTARPCSLEEQACVTFGATAPTEFVGQTALDASVAAGCEVIRGTRRASGLHTNERPGGSAMVADI